MKPDFLLDFGNTTCKVARIVDEKPVELSRVALEPLENIPASIIEGSNCVLAGSAPRAIQAWEGKLRSTGCKTRVLSRADIPLKLRMEDPSTVGIDRLLGAMGASMLHAERTILVVDAGTAITFNLVDAEGVFQGGAILPGLGLMARSLAQNTEQLPQVNFRKSIPEFPASTTPKAIRMGIHLAATGAIHRAWHLCLLKDPLSLLIFTGSDAVYLAAEFPEAQPEPFLIHWGMLACLAEGQ